MLEGVAIQVKGHIIWFHNQDPDSVMTLLLFLLQEGEPQIQL